MKKKTNTTKKDKSPTKETKRKSSLVDKMLKMTPKSVKKKKLTHKDRGFKTPLEERIAITKSGSGWKNKAKKASDGKEWRF